jgi:hypothetical protein
MALKSFDTARPDKYVTVGGFSKKGEKNPEWAEGYYLGSVSGTNQFDEGKTKVIFMLKTPAGIIGVNGNANLVNKMQDSERGFKAATGNPPIGAFLRIDFTGEVKSGKGNPMKTFKVQFDDENVIDVAAVSSQDENSSYQDEEDETEEQPEMEAPVKTNTAALAADRAARKARTEALLNKGKK